MPKNIDELKGHAKTLLALLEDPHPGASTWQENYQAVMKSIATFLPLSEFHRNLDVPKPAMPLEERLDNLALYVQQLAKVTRSVISSGFWDNVMEPRRLNNALPRDGS